MDDLNRQQRQAAEAKDGPVAIIAGPGTGKTKTLAARIKFLIESKQSKPKEILALTFTKKSAQEMARRVETKGPLICTFHSLCQRFLGADVNFVSEQQRLSIIKKLRKPSLFKSVSTRELGLLISRVKNGAEQSAVLASLTDEYNHEMKTQGLIDFDDLLLNLRNSLVDNSIAKPKFTHILVDEFQDTNSIQYELIQLLRQTDNLFVIGDPRQSIYGFRGASSSIFDKFLSDFPAAKVVDLCINYRSSPEIIRLGNAIFAKESQLKPAKHTAGKVKATEFLNAYSEARWVVGQIQQSIGGVHMQQNGHLVASHSLKDFAIIYRSRRAARAIQKVIADSGLPYQTVGDGSPYDSLEIQKIIAVLRIANGEQVTIPGFSGLQTATFLQNLKLDLSSPVELAEEVRRALGIENSSNVKQFFGTLVRFKDINSAVEYLDSISSNNFYDPSAEVITLLTIHASKGLEFPCVFFAGASAEVIPAENSDEQEEKRLFYVAVTRAKSQLEITYCGKPSPFITQLSPEVLPTQRDPNLAQDAIRLKKRMAKRAQTTFF